MLHIISQLSLDTALLERTNPDDCLLFIESGVFALVKDNETSKKIIKFLINHSLYALASDMQLRGLRLKQLVNGVTLVDYAGFVDLVVAHPTVVSWR